TEIAMIKFYGAQVLYNVIDRAIQVHGSLGFSTDMPLEAMYRHARAARIYDGPDEVHRVTVARQMLKGYKPVDVPTEHVPTRRARNLPDGRVEVVAEGDEHAVERMIQWCRAGPPRATVTAVELQDEPPTAESGFAVR